MTLRTKLLGAGAALLLSTGAALAVPATAQTDLNVRSGPGTQYPVVGSIQAGETVDAGGCTGSWCQVRFSGGSGFASRSYLAMGGGVPGPAVAVAPYAAAPYVYDEPDYDYGYYDYGYAYGPSFGFYANPRFRHRQGWQGRPGWNGGGNWAGRPGGSPPVAGQPAGSGFAGPPANWQRPGTGIGAGARVGAGSGFAGGGARVGAGAGFSGGGGFRGGAAAAPAAPAGGGSGFTGVPVRGAR
jgi:uncharacterized protein YraI